MELRPVGNHALAEVWEDNIALNVIDLLDTMKVNWTTADIVRIGKAKETSAHAPVILWIGVRPTSLSRAEASKRRKLLEENNITDVEVEIRESVVTRSVGPELLMPASDTDPIVSLLPLRLVSPSLPTLHVELVAFSSPREGTQRGSS